MHMQPVTSYTCLYDDFRRPRFPHPKTPKSSRCFRKPCSRGRFATAFCSARRRCASLASSSRASVLVSETGCSMGFG